MGRLTTKFTVPDSSDAVFRHRLIPVLDTVPKHKLTLVIAGAGYGKTTLVAQACEHLGLNLIWFRAKNHTLEDFIEALVMGISNHYPGFEFSWISDLSGQEIQTLAAQFMNELEAHVTQDLFLVVDGCHCLGSSPKIQTFLQVILDHFFPGLHIILAGRSLPDLKLSRLTAERQVLRIFEPDLAFDHEEVGQLYSSLFNLSLTREHMDLLCEKTKGWVSGLILFYQSLGKTLGDPKTSAIGDAISRLKGTHRLIADYFKENVYDFLVKEDREILLKIAVLNSIETGFCNRFFEIDNARSILCRLEDRHCFISAMDEDRNYFVIHPLFREFLGDRIQTELGPDFPARLYGRAAQLYEKTDQGQEALTHHILAGNIEDAARLLNRFARPMIKQDRPHMLKSLLSVIPAHYMDDEPWFQYLQAGYYGLCSKLQTAVKAYEKVLKKFRSQKDEQGECMVLMELAEYYLAAGELKQSEQALFRVLAKDKLDPYLTIIVMGYLIRVLALAQRTSEADKYARKAIRLLRELDDETSLNMGRAWIYVAQGYRYAFSGGYQRAMELGEDAKPLFRSAGQDRFLFSAYFLISYSCFYLGRFSKGMAAAQEGIQLAKGKGIYDEFSEFLRLLRAKNSLELPDIEPGQVDQALADCKKSLESFETSSFPGGVAQGYLVLHQAWLCKGDVHKAEKSLRRGMAVIRENDMPLIKNELHVALSSLLLFDRDQTKKGEAFSLLKDAEQDLLYSGWHISWISRIFARYYWEHGHRDRAYEYMVYSLKISEEESFDAWILSEKEWIVPILVALFDLGTMRSYLTAQFRRMGSGVQPQLAQLQNTGKGKTRRAAGKILALIPREDPLSITAFFFDRFQIFVGHREITADQWKSRKALTLFKYMVAMGSNGFLDREILMELLWPEEDPKKSAQRFHVAMASIRKTLEPDIPRGTRSTYIQRTGQAYGIVLGKKGRVDIALFAEAILAGKSAHDPEAAASWYEKAKDLYRGDFLREDPYEDWCAKARDRYHQDYLFALKQFMVFRETRGDYLGCISLANTYLTNDPYAEEVIRKLMEYHACTGNKPMVSMTYERFKQAVLDDLNCGVSDETKFLYHKLVVPI